jgi:hypothetical protein
MLEKLKDPRLGRYAQKDCERDGRTRFETLDFLGKSSSCPVLS